MSVMVQSPDSEPFRTEILEFLKQKRGIDPPTAAQERRGVAPALVAPDPSATRGGG